MNNEQLLKRVRAAIERLGEDASWLSALFVAILFSLYASVERGISAVKNAWRTRND